MIVGIILGTIFFTVFIYRYFIIKTMEIPLKDFLKFKKNKP